MKDMIEWLEEKIAEYKRDADYSERMVYNADYFDGATREKYITRQVIYTSVWRDFERKLMEVKALQECQITM